MKTLSLAILVSLFCSSFAQANNGAYWAPQPAVVYNTVPPPILVFQQPIVVFPPPPPVIIYQPVVVPPPQVIVIDNRWVMRPCFPILFPRY